MSTPTRTSSRPGTPHLPCPVRRPDRMGLGELADLLDAPVHALRGVRPAKHV